MGTDAAPETTMRDEHGSTALHVLVSRVCCVCCVCWEAERETGGRQTERERERERGGERPGTGPPCSLILLCDAS